MFSQNCFFCPKYFGKKKFRQKNYFAKKKNLPRKIFAKKILLKKNFAKKFLKIFFWQKIVSLFRVHSTYLCEANKSRNSKPFFVCGRTQTSDGSHQKKIEEDTS